MFSSWYWVILPSTLTIPRIRIKNRASTPCFQILLLPDGRSRAFHMRPQSPKTEAILITLAFGPLRNPLKNHTRKKNKHTPLPRGFPEASGRVGGARDLPAARSCGGCRASPVNQAAHGHATARGLHSAMRRWFESSGHSGS